ncbi:MAG: livK [Pseudonocardiales bacterium]|nr:livK [Pseudonocardiales bacterium]
MKRVLVAGSVLALALVASACSSSSTGTSGTSGGAGTSAAAGGLPAPTGSPASGKPLNVFFFNEEGASAAASSPESYQAAQAAADYVNKYLGGVKGRPITLTHCATLGTPDSVTNCANRAVDAKPDVVVKGVEVASATAVPIITGAGLPYVTLNAGAPAELTTKGSYVLSAGFAAQFAPVAPYMQSKNYKSLGVIYTNVTSLSTALDGTLSKLVAKDNIKYVSSPVDITTGDLTPAYNALVAKKVDAILVVTSAGQCAATLKARAALSNTIPLLMSSSCNVASVLSTVDSSVTKGAVFALLDTSAVASDADTKLYLQAMKTFEPAANVGAFAPSSFAPIVDLYRALSTVSDPSTLNATTIASTLDTASNVPLFMGGGKTFSCATTYFSNSPSVCTGAAYLVSYNSGNYALVGAYDAADLLKGI